MSIKLAKRLPLSTQLIGVDGGATRVRAHEVEAHCEPSGGRLELGKRSAQREYARVSAFESPAERGVLDPQRLGAPTPAEREQGWCWIEAVVQAVLEVARERSAKDVLLGLAMPGTKTADGRGIEFARNGPRIPDFAAHVEDLLASEGLTLRAPIARLESDGWCSGVGERFASAGALRGVHTGYSIGGGTGLAEALLLGGELQPAETIEAWFPRAWRLQYDGRSFEDVLSARGINARWAEISGFELPLEPGRFPEDQLHRDPRARELFESVGAALAELVARRALALALRADELGIDTPALLERVVLGQRLGELFEAPRTRSALRATFERELDLRLRQLGIDGSFPPDGGRGVERRRLVCTSSLPASAALGAAGCAWSAWGQTGA